MKIGIDARAYSVPSGMGIYITGLLHKMLEYDKTNEYVIYSRKRTLITIDNARIDWRVVNGGNIIWKHLYLPGELKREKIDIMFFPDQTMPILPVKCRTIVTVHDVTFIKYKSRPWFETWRLLKMIEKILQKADGIIYDSQNTKQDIRDISKNKKQPAVVVYPGYENEIFNPTYSLDQWQKVKIKYNINYKYIIYLGDLRPHKNITGLLKALDNISEMKLILVGSDKNSTSSQDSLVDNMITKGKAIKLGVVPRSDLPGLIKGAECLVLPSFYEGFGLPIIEAMACGTPVACSNRGSLPEIAGNSAEYFDPQDIDSITKAIINITTNKKRYDELQALGYLKASEYSWVKAAQKTLNMFQLVANEK